jgi:hypothetical protein
MVALFMQEGVLDIIEASAYLEWTKPSDGGIEILNLLAGRGGISEMDLEQIVGIPGIAQHIVPKDQPISEGLKDVFGFVSRIPGNIVSTPERAVSAVGEAITRGGVEFVSDVDFEDCSDT